MMALGLVPGLPDVVDVGSGRDVDDDFEQKKTLGMR